MADQAISVTLTDDEISSRELIEMTLKGNISTKDGNEFSAISLTGLGGAQMVVLRGSVGVNTC